MYGEELITVIKQLEEVRTKEVESIEIAGLDHGLTTKWYTYNFLSVDNQAVAKLREFIKVEVRNYMQDLGHEEGELYLQSWANLLKNKEILKIHSHAGPYSYVSGVFFVKTVASSTCYFLPLDRRIPGVEDFYETEIEVKNVEGGLVIFPSFIEHCSTPTLKKLERMTVAFDVLKEAPIDRYHNGFGFKVVDKF
ncbi:MAG: putative 2OG-Fe(II) oxygenase [Bacteroidota bacterium]